MRYPYPGGVGVPRLGQPWLLTCTPSFSGSTFRSSQKARKIRAIEIFFRGKFQRRGGSPPFSPRGRVGLCRGEADPSLMTKLCVGARYMTTLGTSNSYVASTLKMFSSCSYTSLPRKVYSSRKGQPCLGKARPSLGG